jgi:hypothetical protein
MSELDRVNEIPDLECIRSVLGLGVRVLPWLVLGFFFLKCLCREHFCDKDHVCFKHDFCFKPHRKKPFPWWCEPPVA